jgi:hypothetical protein
MFTVSDFTHLRFLEGRWIGQGPDGADFYEKYSFPSETEMRADRYADASFSTPTDGSVVALQSGQVTSVWKEFKWSASELAPGKACFVPINAPSSFCWERVSDREARVTQKWTDEKGAPQEYSIPLRRL